MDFQLSDEQVQLKQTVRRLAEREFLPRAAHWDEEEAFPWDNVPILREAGLLGLALPEAYGGSGGTVFDLALVMEQLARCCVATAFIVGQQNGFGAKAIALFGTEEQQRRYLPGIIRGERLIAWAMSEPGAGSDLRNLVCRARRTGDGYVLDGRKTFCSLGGVSHLNVVICRFDDVQGFPGLGAVIVEDSFQSLRQIKENQVLLCKILTEGIIQPLVNCIGRQIETMSPLPAVAETMEGMTESLSQLQQDVARLKRAADFTLANMPPSKFQTL